MCKHFIGTMRLHHLGSILSVPAVHAYAAFSGPWRSWFTEKFSGSARRSDHERLSQYDSDSAD